PPGLARQPGGRAHARRPAHHRMDRHSRTRRLRLHDRPRHPRVRGRDRRSPPYLSWGVFTLFFQDALRIPKAMRKARNADGPVARRGFATRRMAFGAATRRERDENSATRRCTPRPGSSLAVVARLDWRCSHPVRTWKNSVSTPWGFYQGRRPEPKPHNSLKLKSDATD